LKFQANTITVRAGGTVPAAAAAPTTYGSYGSYGQAAGAAPVAAAAASTAYTQPYPSYGYGAGYQQQQQSGAAWNYGSSAGQYNSYTAAAAAPNYGYNYYGQR
jgi:hypothetical protein